MLERRVGEGETNKTNSVIVQVFRRLEKSRLILSIVAYRVRYKQKSLYLQWPQYESHKTDEKGMPEL